MLASFLHSNLTFAQTQMKERISEVVNPNVTKKTSCKLLTMTLWQGQEARTKVQAKQQIKDVAKLQKLLDRLGYYGEEDRIDKNYDSGFFDTTTRIAVKKFQEDNMPFITANGKVGPKTLEYLNKYEFCNANRDFADLKLDKVYTYPDKSFSFLYPSAELKLADEILESEAKSFRTYLQLCNVDEHSRQDFLLKNLCYKKGYNGNFFGAALKVNVLTEKKTEIACATYDEANKDALLGDIENINGFDFYKYKTGKIGLGNVQDIRKYRFFNKGKCVEFVITLESSRVAEDDGSLKKVIKEVEAKLKVSLENLIFK